MNMPDFVNPEIDIVKVTLTCSACFQYSPVFTKTCKGFCESTTKYCVNFNLK